MLVLPQLRLLGSELLLPLACFGHETAFVPVANPGTELEQVARTFVVNFIQNTARGRWEYQVAVLVLVYIRNVAEGRTH
jgi:hypothetical protein